MDNNDLVWDLEIFNKRQWAQNFVMGFENRLCVYSGTVEQLYTNYNIFFPRDDEHKLVILPNPYAHHDTFQGITEDCVSATGLFLVPEGDGKSKSSRRLQMLLPLRGGKSEFRRVPLNVGLRLINQKRSPKRPFLPVLMKGDLREFDTDTPCIHLHMLKLSCISKLSDMELNDIQMVVLRRLEALASAR